MLDSLFMLHCISDVPCYHQQQPKFDVRFFHWIHSQHLILSDMNVDSICVNTTGFLSQIIYIRRCRENIQHYMSDNPDLVNI